MASRRRKRKICAPDWVGESYDDKSDAESEDKLDAVTSKCKSSARSTPSTDSASSKLSRGRLSEAPLAADVNSGQEVQLSASDIIAQSMPYLQFEGSLIYSYHSGDCSLLCEDILASLAADQYLHVGFDLEWPVTYIPGSSAKVALVQICTAGDKCYLFHVAAMGNFPQALKTLICHPNVIKYGLNIVSDLWKLERDFDIQVRDVIRKSARELGTVANEKLKSAERWTLDGLCRNVLRKRLDKNFSVRCGSWNDYPLSEEQRHYASADAYASLLLARHFFNF